MLQKRLTLSQMQARMEFNRHSYLPLFIENLGQVQDNVSAKLIAVHLPTNHLGKASESMSHFASVITKLINRKALVEGLKEALKSKGIFDVEIENLTQRRRLVNNYDGNDERYAEVILSHSYLSTPDRQAMVDVGYLWKGGQYELQIDDYDYTRNCLGAAFGDIDSFAKAVQFEHDKILLQETLLTSYPATEWEYGEQSLSADGTITMLLTKKPQLTGYW